MRRLGGALTVLAALSVVPSVRAADCDPRLADAILYTEDSKESHRVWVDYLELHPELDVTPGVLASKQEDLEWQREMVRRYDVVLELLLDTCDVSGLEIPWDQTLVPWRSQVTGEVLVLGEGPFDLDHRGSVGDPAPQQDRADRLGRQGSLRFVLR